MTSTSEPTPPSSAPPEGSAEGLAEGPAARALRAVIESLDRRDWEALASLLSAGFAGRFVHSGEVFDRAGYVALNRDYPGHWALELQDLVDAGSRAVVRARVTDAEHRSDETHHLAAFGTVDARGLVAELVEVWAEQAAPPSDRRTDLDGRAV